MESLSRRILPGHGVVKYFGMKIGIKTLILVKHFVLLVYGITDSMEKTGMGKAKDVIVDAWFTGFAEGTEGKIYFCVHLGGTDGMNVSSSVAKEIAIQIVSGYYGQ